jgi:hypothetical protein
VLSRGLDRVGDSVIGQFMLSPDFAESLGSCGPVGQAMCVFEGLHRIDPQQIAAIETILSLNPATAAARAVQQCRAGDQEACLSVSTAILEAMGSGARTAAAIVQRMTNDGIGGGGAANRTLTNADFPEVNARVSTQRQARHIEGAIDPRTGLPVTGSVMRNQEDAQQVLDAYRAGDATVIGQTQQGFPVVRYNGVTGLNNNPGAGYLNQETNVFIIKVTSSPSIVPTNPSFGQ